MDDDVTDRVAEMIGDMVGLDAEAVRKAPSVAELPDWDSLQQLNLLLALEETFDVPLSPDDLPALDRLDTIRNLVTERRAGG